MSVGSPTTTPPISSIISNTNSSPSVLTSTTSSSDLSEQINLTTNEANSIPTTTTPSISISPTSPLIASNATKSDSISSTEVVDVSISTSLVGGVGGPIDQKKIVLLRRPNPIPTASTSSISPSTTTTTAIVTESSSLESTTILITNSQVKEVEILSSQLEKESNSIIDPVEVLIESTTSASVAPESIQLNHAIASALLHPRDRILLLRAELELELFVADPSYVSFILSLSSFFLFANLQSQFYRRTRLPLSPPHFTPSLNSYQRLLIHKLADTFGITREVEPLINTQSWNSGGMMSNGMNNNGMMPVGVVVLVKGASTKL